uniref:Uncharacterized protein n=1 Tax=Lotus japonicus TaxID=34305 RepID=I3SX05_LOTJA|nr:unknown [Lotus japonicus]
MPFFPQFLGVLVPYLELLVVVKQSLVRLFLSTPILTLFFTLVVGNVEMKWLRF